MPTVQGKHYRYHAVASRLPRLPRELVHEVLGDLSIQNILELLCNHNLPYLDECASSHFTIKKFLPPTDLPEVKEYFTLYLNIRQVDRSDPHPRIKQFEHDVHHFSSAAAANFIPTIKSAILQELKTYHPFLPVLGHFIDAPSSEDQGDLMAMDTNPESPPNPKFPDPVFWDTKSAAGLRSIFELIDAAEVKLNTEKKAQLTRMADLLERYPNILRTCCEKNQELRNQKHRVDYLRLQAARIPTRQILENQFVARIVFAQNQFYLVPYDKSVIFLHYYR
ncbi:hypothetical protein EST38_g3123 [Candolleomyces aberdarensis]|uniref:Uncharacterized protein n=1 Tax=Candolleomyces aberdarensis TaxID=2316362 RepID=A0A4Q2DQR7_9AGAR|nr:hypothetical protein EST38_g3123 [Candolleomyces aberdarensis]